MALLNFLCFSFLLFSLSFRVEASVHEYNADKFTNRGNAFVFHGGSEGIYASVANPNATFDGGKDDSFIRACRPSNPWLPFTAEGVHLKWKSLWWASAIENLEVEDPGSDKNFGMQQRPDGDIEIDEKFWEEDFEIPNCQKCGGMLKPDALEQAWTDACASPGGAQITIPKGNFWVGPVVFNGQRCQNGTYVFQIDGNLLADTNLGKYTKNWLDFRYINGLVIKGSGTLDGQGTSAWPQNFCKKKMGMSFAPTELLLKQKLPSP